MKKDAAIKKAIEKTEKDYIKNGIFGKKYIALFQFSSDTYVVGTADMAMMQNYKDANLM